MKLSNWPHLLINILNDPGWLFNSLQHLWQIICKSNFKSCRKFVISDTTVFIWQWSSVNFICSSRFSYTHTTLVIYYLDIKCQSKQRQQCNITRLYFQCWHFCSKLSNHTMICQYITKQKLMVNTYAYTSYKNTFLKINQNTIVLKSNFIILCLF